MLDKVEDHLSCYLQASCISDHHNQKHMDKKDATPHPKQCPNTSMWLPGPSFLQHQCLPAL
eukprot:Gb_22356 [translate_table: standard]